MKILLDTHAFLWLMTKDQRLSSTAQKEFLNTQNEIYLSMASVWEMAIKSSIGKLKLPLKVSEYVISRTQQHGIYLEEIKMEHLAKIEKFPFHHRDPFDRLIIAQSIVAKFTVLTSDPKFSAYAIRTIW